MTNAPFSKFYTFVQDLASELHNMATGTSDQYMVYLTGAQPSPNNTMYGTPADLPTGNGYVAGGESIGPVTGMQVNGVFTFFGATNPFWLSNGNGAIGPFEYAVLYNASSGRLIGWWDFGSQILLTNGSTFGITLDQVNGILSIQ